MHKTKSKICFLQWRKVQIPLYFDVKIDFFSFYFQTAKNKEKLLIQGQQVMHFFEFPTIPALTGLPPPNKNSCFLNSQYQMIYFSKCYCISICYSKSISMISTQKLSSFNFFAKNPQHTPISKINYLSQHLVKTNCKLEFFHS